MSDPSDAGGGSGPGSGEAPPTGIETAEEAAPTRAAGSPGATQPPLIEFPTFYTFKAMGLAGPMRERVLALVAEVLGPVEPASVSVRLSSAGKYESVSVHVYLHSEDERRRIYEAFHGDKSIVWYV